MYQIAAGASISKTTLYTNRNAVSISASPVRNCLLRRRWSVQFARKRVLSEETSQSGTWRGGLSPGIHFRVTRIFELLSWLSTLTTEFKVSNHFCGRKTSEIFRFNYDVHSLQGQTIQIQENLSVAYFVHPISLTTQREEEKCATCWGVLFMHGWCLPFRSLSLPGRRIMSQATASNWNGIDVVAQPSKISHYNL